MLQRIVAAIFGGGGVPWLTILRLFLTIANQIADIVREKQLMDAGEALATAKQLAEIAHSVGIGNEVNAAIDALSEPQVQDEVEADAR